MLNTAPIASVPPSSCGMPACATACGNATASDETHPFSQELGRAEARQRAASGDAPDAADGANADATAPGREAPGVRHADAADTRAMAGARRGAAPTLALRDALADLLACTPADAATEPASDIGVPPIEAEPGTLDGAAQVLSELAALMAGLPVPRTVATGGSATPAQRTHRTTDRLEGEGPGRSALAHEHAPGQRAAAARDAAQGSEHAASAFAQGTQALSMATLTQAAGAHPTPAHGAISLPVDPAAAAQGIRAITEAAWQGTAPTTADERALGGAETLVAGATPLASAVLAATARSEVAALPFQAELRAALGSSEFAPALGARLSMLVQDGIEHAQLKLNPAEMGPIEVRIRLDGSQAQVDFSAAHAGTRQALQDAVPALASALRDSGLTLTGGGVFEQPREPRGEPRPHESRSGFTPGEPAHDSALAGTGVPRMPRARGVLDLYA